MVGRRRGQAKKQTKYKKSNELKCQGSGMPRNQMVGRRRGQEEEYYASR
jgi:hypothetical protein